jgi:PKD repeat protein
VSAANSLVGSTLDDQVGCSGGDDDCPSSGVVALNNGNYLVFSPYWHNGAADDAGAVTWGSGATGVSGVVSAANSLVGSAAGDQVGCRLGGVDDMSYGVVVLSNGNYVVNSKYWDNGAAADAGAVTWGNGTTGVKGAVSAANSLVGSTAGDRVGYWGVTALSNGNYVVNSPGWDNGTVVGAGAVTWGNGTTGITGVVSAANSLVGSTEGDGIGFCGWYDYGVTALSNGNYVVNSPDWDNDGVVDAGAVTWGNGMTGITGAVSAANSLVGSTADDRVGDTGGSAAGVTALSNGSYVVLSPYWDNGAVVDAAAVTWGSGTSGVKGVVSAANSLVGSSANDRVGYAGSSEASVTALSNGSYVVRSPYWDNGAIIDAGAVTWGSGTSGAKGVVSAANSLVGSTTDDRVGYVGPSEASVTALSNGNYVVRSTWWDNGAVVDAGAVTWGSGAAGIVGEVSETNSLVGSMASDLVGWGGVTALSNGNYVVRSSDWDNGALVDAGAVTWGSGTTGVKGVVSAANSLVGSTTGDGVGFELSSETGVTALSNGDYVVRSPYWDNGAIIDAGAVTWGRGLTGVYGPIAAENSVRGTAASSGRLMVWAYDSLHYQLVVGRPGDNIVTLFRDEAVTAGFSGTPTSGSAPLLVSFTNQSTGDYDTCAWDFGDGGTSDSCTNPVHTYTAVGVYTVTLTLSGSGGTDTETKTGYIEVWETYHIYMPLILRRVP